MISISYDINYTMYSEYENTQHSRVLRKNIENTAPTEETLKSALEEILQELRGVRKNACLWSGCDVRDFIFTIDFSEDIQWDENMFFSYCTQYERLDEKVLEYISLSGNNFFSGEAIWGSRFWGMEEFHSGEYAVFLLAMRDKKYINTYAQHLCDSDMGDEVYQGDEIELLINRWGLCEDIITLIAYRLTVAWGQHGLEQIQRLLEHGVGEKNKFQDLCQQLWNGQSFEKSSNTKTIKSEISEARNLLLLVNAIAVGSCYTINVYLASAHDSEQEFYDEIRYRYEKNMQEWFVEDDSLYKNIINNLPQSFISMLEKESERVYVEYIDQITHLGFQKNIKNGSECDAD